MQVDNDLNVCPGETWITRAGSKVKIDQIDEANGEFPLRFADQSWMRNGRYWSNEFPHSKDLIRKYHEQD